MSTRAHVVTAPEPLVVYPTPHPVSVFLAGGITGCPDWQSEMIKRLEDEPVTIFNPRRPVWDMNDRTATRTQIAWEFHALKMASLVLFWFPEETLCPIALFELGKCLGRKQKILVATHHRYARRTDVYEQLELEDYPYLLGESLEWLAPRAKQQIDNLYRENA